ncbi:REX family transcriptional regulator [Arthrobacter sp. LS16]|nr:REX family transcriptional regulator [Arthrobacter sp. LS16]
MGGRGMSELEAKVLPEATVARLTQYLRALNALESRGMERTSSGVLAKESGVNPAILRKDLSWLGSYGTRGVGYVVRELSEHIKNTLGLNRDWRVLILGAGNLGRALSGYAGFTTRGFKVRAILDVSPDLVGTDVGNLHVESRNDLAEVVRREEINIAVLAVPGDAAQDLIYELGELGVNSVLSFAPKPLVVPRGMNLRRVDLSTELQILAYLAVQP